MYSRESYIYKACKTIGAFGDGCFERAKTSGRKYQFDYIFMDPPYRKMLEKQVLEYLSESTILSQDAVVIVESSLDTEFSYVEELGFSVIKEKIYKTNKHIFLEREA